MLYIQYQPYFFIRIERKLDRKIKKSSTGQDLKPDPSD